MTRQNLSMDLPVTYQTTIPKAWTDYNGHMNEVFYLEASCQASDHFMQLVGADAAYIEAGQSYFTAENHVIYRQEMREGQRLRVTSQVLQANGRKLHLFNRIIDDEGAVCAMVETFLVHVDLKTRQSCDPSDAVQDRLTHWRDAHSALPWPIEAGRGIRRPAKIPAP